MQEHSKVRVAPQTEPFRPYVILPIEPSRGIPTGRRVNLSVPTPATVDEAWECVFAHIRAHPVFIGGGIH